MVPARRTFGGWFHLEVRDAQDAHEAHRAAAERGAARQSAARTASSCSRRPASSRQRALRARLSPSESTQRRLTRRITEDLESGSASRLDRAAPHRSRWRAPGRPRPRRREDIHGVAFCSRRSDETRELSSSQSRDAHMHLLPVHRRSHIEHTARRDDCIPLTCKERACRALTRINPAHLALRWVPLSGDTSDGRRGQGARKRRSRREHEPRHSDLARIRARQA